MKKLILIAALGLAGCNNQQPAQTQSEQPQAEIVQEPVKAHNYSLKDGLEYGYEKVVSIDAANAGKAADTLVMFKYAGSKDGIYQAYTTEPTGAVTVLQCNNPCDFLKIMVFYQGAHLKTERMKATEGTIGWSVIADAINGELEPYIGKNKKTGQQVHVWFSEQDGLIATPLK